MIYIPIKDKKKAIFSSAFYFIISILVYVFTTYVHNEILRPLGTVAYLLLFSIALMRLTRYVLTDYRYVISLGETKTDIDLLSSIDEITNNAGFSVVKINGGRENVMAHISFKDIYAYERNLKLKDFEKKYGVVSKVYNFCTNFKPDNYFSFATEFNGKKIMFVVEFSEDYENKFVSIIEKCKGDNIEA